jgi:hypothetical protein
MRLLPEAKPCPKGWFGAVSDLATAFPQDPVPKLFHPGESVAIGTVDGFVLDIE